MAVRTVVVMRVCRLDLVLEARGQPRNTLLRRHVSQRPSRHLRMLSHAAHIAGAALCVLTLQEVINRYRVMASHRRIVFPVPTALVSHHVVVLLNVVQETRTNRGVTTLIAQVLIFVHLFGDLHFSARYFACAGMQSLRCMDIH